VNVVTSIFVQLICVKGRELKKHLDDSDRPTLSKNSTDDAPGKLPPSPIPLSDDCTQYGVQPGSLPLQALYLYNVSPRCTYIHLMGSYTI
jgi:hypothetical protein